MNSKHIDKIVAVAKSLHSRGITSVIDTTAGVLYAVNPEAKSATAATHETTEAPKTGKADESGKVSTILPKRIEFRDGEYVSIYAGKIVKAKKAIEGLREDAKKSPEAKLRWGGEVDGGVFVKTGDIVTLTRKEITEKVKEMKAAGKAKAEKDEKKATASSYNTPDREDILEAWFEGAKIPKTTQEAFENHYNSAYSSLMQGGGTWSRSTSVLKRILEKYPLNDMVYDADAGILTMQSWSDVEDFAREQAKEYAENEAEEGTDEYEEAADREYQNIMEQYQLWDSSDLMRILFPERDLQRAVASTAVAAAENRIPSDLRGKGLGKPRAEGVAPRQVSDKVAQAPRVAKSAPKTAPALPKQVKQPVFKEARENGEGEIEVVVPKAKLATRDIGAGARKPKFD